MRLPLGPHRLPARSPHLHPHRFLSTTRPRLSHPTIPYTETCPRPTCACAPMPAGLAIDRTTPLLNTMAPYAEHVLVCSGKQDWTSRIEDEEGVGEFVRGVKGILRGAKGGGGGFDPFTNILLTASSLPAPSRSPKTDPSSTSIYLLPSFLHIPHIPHTTPAFSALASAYLAPTTLHPLHAPLSAAQRKALVRDATQSARLAAPQRVTVPMILICGHGSRDERCGVLGPVLEAGFRSAMQRKGIEGLVALTSHIGGHRFAGNVVVYLPPGYAHRGAARDASGLQQHANALQGSGIWYGRVGPEHVEGLVEETLVRGRVVGELLRGGVVRGGGDLGRIVEAQRRGEGDEGLKLRPRARAGT